MLRTALLSLILIVSLSSTSMLGKSISRRQSDPQYCHAIEGFECKCSHYRVTCTTDRDLPSPITITQTEKQKYQSVELVITAPRDIQVNEQTFAPVKELYKPDAENLEFRVKFEKFTALQLSSPGIFNQVFPDNLPSNARKHLALEIYNPEVPPNDNPGLFKNLNADSLELYALYPFHGSFQQLFEGANIKYLRLSGGEIRSDISQQFTGNIGRLELAKQASALSVQNFPVYPAHELTINAFYITDFNAEHPPNYNNLGELRVFSTDRIPANAFKNFPNIRTLQITTEKDIDPQALNGLTNLEKLVIKDSKVSLDLLKAAPQVKEFETNVDKLDEKDQCQLVEKLANGQLAVQAIPNGGHCTCATAYLDTAAGRTPCDAQHCAHSSCAAIKNNYDESTKTFTLPPPILRSDGSNALRPRESRVYTAPFQVSQQDQEKLQQGIPQVQQPQPEDGSQSPDGQNPPYNPQGGTDYLNHAQNNQNEQSGSNNDNNKNYYDNDDDDKVQPITTTVFDWNFGKGDTIVTHNSVFDDPNAPQEGDGTNQGGEGQPEDGTENQSNQDGSQSGTYNPNNTEGAAGNGTDTGPPPKKGISWFPIIIIAAAIVGIVLAGFLVLFLRKKCTNKGYGPTATNEQGTAQPTARA